MTFVRSFDGYAPPPRYDSVPFLRALIQESSVEDFESFNLIDTLTLSPVDSDPIHPQLRNLTTVNAELDEGFYRIVWEDESGATFTGHITSYPAAISDADLTTVEAVRQFLQKQGGDTEQDDVIQTLITSASKLISRHCQRQFFPEDEATKTFEWTHSSQPLFVDLAPYELRSATTVKLDTDTASPSTLSSEEFKLWPLPAPDGTYMGIRLNPFSFGATSVRWWPRRQVEITGDWGMSEIPADVAQACVVTVAIWLRRDVSAFASGMKIDEGYVERPKSLPSAVVGMLETWERLA